MLDTTQIYALWYIGGMISGALVVYGTQNVLLVLLTLDMVRRLILSGTKKQILPCIFLWRYKK